MNKRDLPEDVVRAMFHGSEPVPVCAKKLGCAQGTLIARWIRLFGEQAYEERRYRMRSNAMRGDRHPSTKGTDYYPRGEAHHNWNGGTHITESGYRVILAPDWWTGPKKRDNYVYEHRVVYAQETGQTSLPPGYEVHHINGDKADNRFENLELLSVSEHQRRHSVTRMRDSKGRLLPKEARGGS